MRNQPEEIYTLKVEQIEIKPCVGGLVNAFEVELGLIPCSNDKGSLQRSITNFRFLPKIGI